MNSALTVDGNARMPVRRLPVFRARNLTKVYVAGAADSCTAGVVPVSDRLVTSRASRAASSV